MIRRVPSSAHECSAGGQAGSSVPWLILLIHFKAKGFISLSLNSLTPGLVLRTRSFLGGGVCWAGLWISGFITQLQRGACSAKPIQSGSEGKSLSGVPGCAAITHLPLFGKCVWEIEGHLLIVIMKHLPFELR